MLWFYVVFTFLITLFSIAVIGEENVDRKKIYTHVLTVVILFFALITYYDLVYHY